MHPSDSPGRDRDRLAASRLLAAVLSIALSTHRSEAAVLSEVANSVVKLYVTSQAWNVKQPWTKEPADRRTCSGFLIEQGIITNAHCVMDATFVQMEIPGLPDKLEAERVAINHQVDLALLRPKPPDRLPASMKPIHLGTLPDQRDKVVTIGYSIGGRQVSYTEGVVSRIDIMPYAHSNLPNLLIQTDAAINPGNSGGPVFSDRTGQCLGMAVQRFSGSIGYFIPVPVIEQFLTDLKDGVINGVPYVGAQIQTLENPTLREYLQMKPGQSGVRITQLTAAARAAGLREDDVLMSVEGKRIFNDGRIPFRDSAKIGLGFEISMRQIGETVKFTILRSGREMELPIKLSELDYTLIPSLPQYDAQPRYFVLGGLLFMAVEPRYLEKDVPFPIRKYLGKMIGEEDDLEELVVISTVYEAEVNKGYGEAVENMRVVEVNGKKIHRLDDVIAALSEDKGRYHVIVLDNGNKIVLDRVQVEAEEQAIRARYRIR
jgi:S1-C subfamily serine protease